MHKRRGALIVLLVVFLIFAGTGHAEDFKVEPRYPDIFIGYWCTNTIMIIPEENVGLDREVYVKTVKFWQKHVPGIKLSFKDKIGGRDDTRNIVVVKRHQRESSQSQKESDHAYATIHATYQRYETRFLYWCHSGIHITLYHSFFSLSQDLREEYFAHEVGHVLGLRHQDDTITVSAGSLGFILDEKQKVALQEVYPVR